MYTMTYFDGTSNITAAVVGGSRSTPSIAVEASDATFDRDCRG